MEMSQLIKKGEIMPAVYEKGRQLANISTDLHKRIKRWCRTQLYYGLIHIMFPVLSVNSEKHIYLQRIFYLGKVYSGLTAFVTD